MSVPNSKNKDSEKYEEWKSVANVVLPVVLIIGFIVCFVHFSGLDTYLDNLIRTNKRKRVIV